MIAFMKSAMGSIQNAHSSSPHPTQHHNKLWEGDEHQFLTGKCSSCTTNLKWPRQIWPSPQCWTICWSTLHLLFTNSLKSNLLNQGYFLHHWLPHSPSHQKWSTFINSSTLLLYSRIPGGPNFYSIYIPRHRFSHTSSGTSTPLLSTSSVPITVSSWIPYAVSTLFHHKQALLTVPRSLSTNHNNLTHTEPQHSTPKPRKSTLNTHPSAEQLSTATSSLTANISTSFPHLVPTQSHLFTTQHTPPCTTSHKAKVHF